MVCYAMAPNANQGSGDDDLSGSPTKPTPKPRHAPPPKSKPSTTNGDGALDNGHGSSVLENEESGFGGIQRGTDTLTGFKRVQGPKNRRTPSRPSSMVTRTDDLEELDNEKSRDDHRLDGEESPKAVTPILKKRAFINEAEDEDDDDDDVVIPDMNHNATKPSINFLDLHGHPSGQRNSPDRSPSSGLKPFIPPLDLSILHEHGDGNDPILSEQGPSSFAIHKQQKFKEDDVMLSPRMTKLKKKTTAHHDTSVPPSPPTEQTVLNKTRSEEDQMAYIKSLTKKIQSCKRKIKAFDESFETEQGYRPSQSDKASRPEIRKVVQELAKARKDLRRVKEENQNAATLQLEFSMQGGGSPGSFGSAGSIPDTDSNPDDANPAPLPSIEDTFDALHRRLHDKRQDARRPKDLALMRRDQIQDEKLAVQKSLLQYENLHGRPTNKHSKEVMKPLYDRYRNIKRLLAKPLSPRDKVSVELAVLHEGKTIDFPSPSASNLSSNRDSVMTGLSGSEPGSPGGQFMVTQNLGLLKDTLRPLDSNTRDDLSPEGPSPVSWKANLHHMSISQLNDEQQKARVDKKRLRKVLREFEDTFLQQTGRKVQKEDRAPMDAEYLEYKQIKARLKLLDALISKYDPLGVL